MLGKEKRVEFIISESRRQESDVINGSRSRFFPQDTLVTG